MADEKVELARGQDEIVVGGGCEVKRGQCCIMYTDGNDSIWRERLMVQREGKGNTYRGKTLENM